MFDYVNLLDVMITTPKKNSQQNDNILRVSSPNLLEVKWLDRVSCVTYPSSRRKLPYGSKISGKETTKEKVKRHLWGLTYNNTFFQQVHTQRAYGRAQVLTQEDQ